ncbi:retropepsin-like aspartic protease [Flavobacterium ardleyense]|uniref:Retropepsin-like aspartic protease n=1 Tax=Flavobacterium ardleyense TaxID=2038737 RepID=A0ABW5Z669_9FLAO
MRTKLTILLFSFFIISCHPVRKAQVATFTQGQVVQKNYTEEIAFDYYHSIIFLTVEIDKKNYSFVFDTGNSLTVLDDDVYSELMSKDNEVYGKTTDVNNDKRATQYISMKNMQLGKVEFDNFGAQVTDLSALSVVLGCRQIDGILGMNFIKKSKWQIDFKNKKIRFSDDLSKLSVGEKAISLNVVDKKQVFMNFELMLNGVSEVYLLDSASNGGIQGSLAAKDKINAKEELKELQTESFSTGAFGTKINKAYYTIMPSFQIDGVGFKNEIVQFVDQKAKFGTAFLDDYLLTIDYDSGMIYLDDPSKKANPVVNQFEISFRANYEDVSLEVGKIWEASIPELTLGTKIIKINNVDVSNFDRAELCAYWEIEANKIQNMDQVTVQINHNGTPKNIELSRKNLLGEI